MQSKIIELLKAEPNLMANQIIERLQVKPTSLKVTLNKMIKKEKLTRSKVARGEVVKAGPKSVYAYSVNSTLDNFHRDRTSQTTQPA